MSFNYTTTNFGNVYCASSFMALEVSGQSFYSQLSWLHAGGVCVCV